MNVISENEKRRRRKLGFPKGRQVEDGAIEDVRDILGPLSEHGTDKTFLIEHLHKIQGRIGYLPVAHLAALAKVMKLSQAEVYEVASFYHRFNVVKETDPIPPAQTIRVCDSIACKIAGAEKVMESLQSGLDPKEISVVRTPCIGACNFAPVATIGQREILHADISDRMEDAMSDDDTSPFIPDYENFAAYNETGGYDVLRACLQGDRSRDDVTQDIDRSGLKGMGGAGFPTARKWRFLENASKPRILVINADEGEPGTFKDRFCMETEPHKFMEGVLIAAWVIEAEDIYIYLRDEYPHIREILLREIEEIEKAGLADDFIIHLRRGAGAYICGEESALLESIEGKRGLPRNRPPYPAQKGLFGRPTLINNVETLYWVTEILSQGVDHYIDAGWPRFYSVSGHVKNPGVVRAPAGTTARQLIDEHCGGMKSGHIFKAYLPGGASGGILPEKFADLPLDYGALDDYGCFVGSGAVVVFSDQDPIRDIAINLLEFFADESCGQCTPCRLGCEKMVQLMAEDHWNTELLGELADAMRDASICGLGQAAPNPVMSAINFFEVGSND